MMPQLMFTKFTPMWSTKALTSMPHLGVVLVLGLYDQADLHEVGVRRLVLHLHLGQLHGHVLVLDDGLAALDALPGVLQSLLVDRAHGAQVGGGAEKPERRRNTLRGLRPVELRAAPLALGAPGLSLVAQQVLGRDAAVFEDQLGVGEQCAGPACCGTGRS